MIKQYPKEGRIEYVVPNCPRCGKLMRMYEYPNMEVTETIVPLVSFCKNQCCKIMPTTEELAIISSHSPNEISFVDSRGNKL